MVHLANPRYCMRRLSYSLLWLLAASLPLASQEWQAQSEEEALFLRRIADFWKEGEYQIVKSEIEDFLREYPESSFAQTLHASLGDLYVRDGNFKGALMQYSRIVDSGLGEKIFLNRMQCLLELQWFATLADECEAYLQHETLLPEHKQRATHLLAIALYQQCLNSEDDPALLEQLASRALPYFRELLQEGLSDEIAEASAHLCAILKNDAGAAEIYLHLAENPGADREEMLFQAAIFQARFDKELALKTFQGLKSEDAAYNALILAYDCNRYEEILSKKEEISASISPEKRKAARLFFGKSYLQMKLYPEALQELFAFAKHAEPSDALKSALVDILEASYCLGDIPRLQSALDRLAFLYPNDPELPKGYLSQALLEKQACRNSSARDLFQKIQSEFPEATECRAALFEEIHLDFHEKRWEECRARSIDYLARYAECDRVPFVWRFLASASANLCSESPTDPLREQLVYDLDQFLMQKEILAEEERNQWLLLQAKTCYDLKRYRETIFRLEKGPENGNAHLLLALSVRDGFRDVKRFCIEAEAALSLGADLLDPPAIHLALFNAYLDREELDLAAEHLYRASLGAPVLPENLLWLADYYEKKDIYPDRAAFALEAFFAANGIDLYKLEEESLVFEKAFLKLAALYGKGSEALKQISLLESLKAQHTAHPSWSWQEESAVELLLAVQYEKTGRKDRALSLYDRLLAKSATLRTFASATAALKSVRLRVANLDSLSKPELTTLLSLLKTLSLQKNLANEPVHLEAALEYIDLQTRLEKKEMCLEKRLALLHQSKENFEQKEDLLSRDYHAGLSESQEKKVLYQGYLTLFQAEIFHCRSLLSQDEAERTLLLQNAKKLYEEILRSPPTDYLADRAKRQLEQIAE